MKNILKAICLVTLCFNAQAFAQDPDQIKTVDCFAASTSLNQCIDYLKKEITKEEDLAGSDGKILELTCQKIKNQQNKELLECEVDLEYIETAEPNGAGGGEYHCQETYQYDGKLPYKVLKTNCWYRNF